MSISTEVPGFTSEEVRSKIGFCEQLKGGVIMDVVNAEQAAIAEEAGAVAVMALERVPSDIRADGGVARASDPEMIQAIQRVTSIPVMAKVRIGHFVEAQILEALEVDCIDESEVLTPADEEFHVDKRVFKTPFVCGCRNLGEALRRVHEGAAMIRTKGEPGTGNVVEAVRHMRSVVTEIQALRGQDEKGLHRRMLSSWAALGAAARMSRGALFFSVLYQLIACAGGRRIYVCSTADFFELSSAFTGASWPRASQKRA